ncbi:magnesium chelatase ATPase subunit I [Hahella chejuensis KCTC 2396]|uniref:Magnesium chelatase ATPase subunit I n=1 Tax=Hahella chejuensis (strain KCTC 2396) TaxID=349521 RepID=Q2S8B5_HAHCH|nr:ATP-binding protein [Hahella chejuensis]ABC33109.1 magnesium chelatase ATPase subunit I [Hahella chejuensis KCTC 2396]
MDVAAQAAPAAYPFAAVVGQQPLKTALLLAAINPHLGGVLISGPRGSAKSTLARGLADLLPEAADKFVTLPLGASEERLIGSIDLQQAMGERRVQFNPGLLAKAHGGVLYIDEVNLLPDPLVDALLDTAASGVNFVERDGLSHSHPAQFILIGTMNPDEGELRPQLQDRFGLAVTLDETYDVEQRMAIVERRLAFEQDRNAFRAQWRDAQRELKSRIAAARERLPQVLCPTDIQRDIASQCLAASVEGVRADICWRRAAIAHAAWNGRDEVSVEDVAATRSFALSHRAKHQDTPPPPTGAAPPQGGGSANSGGDSSSSSSSGTAGDWGGMPPQRMAADKPVTPQLPEIPTLRSPSSRRDTQRGGAEQRQGSALGRAQRSWQALSSRPDWFATLVHPDNRDDGLREIRYQPRRHSRDTLNCVLLDTSASTLSQRALAQAKGVILGLARQAYLAREKLAVLAFGAQRTEWVIPCRRAPKDIAALLNELPAGGGTPLRQALLHARQLLARQTRANPHLTCRTLLLTDGRSRDPLDDLIWGSPLWVVDTEQTAVRLNRCRQLAQRLGAAYAPLAAVRAALEH